MPCANLVFTRINNCCWESIIEVQGSCISFNMKGDTNAIDLHYFFNSNIEPEIGSKLRVVLSTDNISDCDTVLIVDPDLSSLSGLSLLDTTMCEEIFLQGLTDLDAWTRNLEIYAKFLPINKGLEGFVKRTGMKGLLYK